MANVLITGASGGVAQALHAKLKGQHRCVMIARRAEIADFDNGLQADVSTVAGAQAAVNHACEVFAGTPDALVHCVGNTVIAPITRTNESQYRACMAANIDSAFFTTQAYLAKVSAARAQTPRSGSEAQNSIVLFSSVVATMGVGNHAAIAAAKGAIEALTRSLAADFAAQGVRVNCIAPGLMRTPMTERMLGSETAEKQIAAQYPLGHFGAAADAAEAAAWLISDASRWITGQVLHLDGGFSAIRPYVRA